MKKALSFFLSFGFLITIIPQASASLLNTPSEGAIQYAEFQDMLRCFEPRKSIRSNTAGHDIQWKAPITVAEASCVLLSHAEIDRRSAFEKSQDFTNVDTEGIDAYHVPFVKEAYRRSLVPDGKRPIDTLHRYEALKMLLNIEGVPILRVLRDEDRTHNFSDVKKDTEMEFIMMTSINRDLVRPVSARVSGAKQYMTRGEYINAVYRSGLVGHADFIFEKPQSFYTDDDMMIPFIDIYAEPIGSIPRYDVFLTIWDILANNHLYSENFDPEKAMNKILEALPQVLEDPYTAFMDSDENESFQDSIRGDFEGIGAYISKEGEDLVIVSPIKKTPADKAGLKSGDIVVKINGESTKELSLRDAVKKIKGPRDTKVTLTIRRNGSEFPVSIVRAYVEIPAVEFEMRENNVMYINMYQFSENAEMEFKKAVDAVQSRNVSAVVLDLRNNPGGLLSSVEKISGYFVGGNKTIVKVEYRNVLQELLSAGKGELGAYPLAVLINKGSASASEILAGVIQDYGVGKVVGTTSFGKGTVQEILPFFDGSSFRYTVARWLTPKGHSIDKNGIKPDFEAEDIPETAYIDEAYEKAVDQLLYMNRIPGVNIYY